MKNKVMGDVQDYCQGDQNSPYTQFPEGIRFHLFQLCGQENNIFDFTPSSTGGKKHENRLHLNRLTKKSNGDTTKSLF